MTAPLASAGIVVASRATALLAAACALAPRSTALLPALYCEEVAAAIEALGLSYRCYDLEPDFGAPDRTVADAMSKDVGVVVVNHCFGLARPISRRALSESTILVEDAAHALRTSWASSSIGALSDVLVWSPRKEFGWPEGGVARGNLAEGLSPKVESSSSTASRWARLDLEAATRAGRSTTVLAVDALRDRLPHVLAEEVLTALPLLSRRRDELIAELRAEGILAWRWLRPLKGTGSQRTPVTSALRRKLLLVPTLDGPVMERCLDLLLRADLEPWPRGRSQ